MTALGIAIFRNEKEVSVKSLKTDVRDAMLSHIEEQLIQKYEYIQGANKGKEYRAMVSYEPGKRMFKLTYDATEDENGADIKSFKFDELDDYI